MPTTSAGPASAAVTGTITVLRAAAMFDGVSPALIVAPSVVIADGAIAAVHGPADAVPPDASVIDLPGLTLMPGLVDTHLHLCFDATGDPIGHLAQADDDMLRQRMADAARRALLQPRCRDAASCLAAGH